MQINTDWIQTTSDEDLLVRYRFHNNDRGCDTMELELKRMYLVQEIGDELRRRGIQLH